jgi:diguanylate cyclase (GGDEF)-like protein
VPRFNPGTNTADKWEVLDHVQTPEIEESEAGREVAEMTRVAGGMWALGAAVGATCAFLPGAEHGPRGPLLALSVVVFLYGIGQLTGAIPWSNATITAHAIGTALTAPIVGAAIYMSGGSLSYMGPFLFCFILFIAFFFPARWAWPLSIEMILVAGSPLIYDGDAIDNAFLPRYIALAAAFVAITAVMVQLKQRLVDAEAHQREIANRDPLTGVGNRRAFDRALHDALTARVGPQGGRRVEDAAPLALLIFDFDGFKAINDEHGHAAGDAVLRRAADRAQGVLRSNDTLARIGGDEFAVIAPGAGAEGARMIADALHGAIGEIEPSWETPVCISVGLATFPEDGEDFESLLRQADQRMLDLKHKRAKPIAPRPLLRPVPTLDDSPSGPQRSVKPQS